MVHTLSFPQTFLGPNRSKSTILSLKKSIAMKDLLQKMTYGHYVLTALKKSENLQTRDEDYIAAGTVNWATQVSFDPPMLAVAVGQKSDLNETIDYSEGFTLHLLSQNHKEMIEKFAGKSDIQDGKVNGIPFEKESGNLKLENTVGRLVCRLKKSENVGDHTVHFGEITQAEKGDDEQPTCTMEVPVYYTKEQAEI